MPNFEQPLEKGSNHQESLDCANKMQVLAIRKKLTPKLHEVKHVSSLNDIFPCYHWRQLYVTNPRMNFSSAVPNTTPWWATWAKGAARFLKAARPTAAIDFKRSTAGSTTCLSCGRGGGVK